MELIPTSPIPPASIPPGAYPLPGDASGCPCGSRSTYGACCGPLHSGARQAATPEELMRSRYGAYALGLDDYVFRTWHPRTRPEDVRSDGSLQWTGLQVLDASGDEVEFVASYEGPAGPGRMHERSRFARRAGRWMYLDGEVT